MRLAESVRSAWLAEPTRLTESVRLAESVQFAEPARLAEPTQFVLYRSGKTARTAVSAVSAVSAVPEKARKVLDSWVWTIGAVCSVHTAAWATHCQTVHLTETVYSV